MEIRKVNLSDIESLSVLFDLYRVFYKQPSDITAAKAFLLERMEKDESVIFVAVFENELVGFTQLYPIFSSVSMRRTWLLNDLFVDERGRKKGVGEALLKAAAEHGAITKSKWLLLQTEETNKAAQALYEKTGWQRVSDRFYQIDI